MPTDPDLPDPGNLPDPPPESTNEYPARPDDCAEHRTRALEAETLAAHLTTELDRARAELAALHRTHELTALLHDAGAIDPDAALVLLNHASPDENTVAAVAALQREKPYLFRALRASTHATSMPPTRHMTNSPTDLDDALHLAATKGDRPSLLRYLRLRRVL